MATGQRAEAAALRARPLLPRLPHPTPLRRPSPRRRLRPNPPPPTPLLRHLLLRGRGCRGRSAGGEAGAAPARPPLSEVSFAKAPEHSRSERSEGGPTPRTGQGTPRCRTVKGNQKPVVKRGAAGEFEACESVRGSAQKVASTGAFAAFRQSTKARADEETCTQRCARTL